MELTIFLPKELAEVLMQVSVYTGECINTVITDDLADYLDVDIAYTQADEEELYEDDEDDEDEVDLSRYSWEQLRTLAQILGWSELYPDSEDVGLVA